MFKIGDFSRICRVPTSALRYYDDFGLLKPAQVDKFTGYRYYTLDQLPRLNRILALKDLGLSLEQIRDLLDESLSPDEIRGMLRLRQVEIEQHIADEQSRLARVAARLRQIEQEGKMPQHDVILKMLETLHVMSVREVIPVGDQVAVLIGALYGALSQSGAEIVGPPFTIYHDEEFKPENLDVEVVFPVSKAVQKSLTLPSGRTALVSDMAAVPTAACVIHSGSYDTLAASYEAIGRWIQENGYRISGAPREIYLTPPQSETGPITEIQFPVEKA